LKRVRFLSCVLQITKTQIQFSLKGRVLPEGIQGATGKPLGHVRRREISYAMVKEGMAGMLPASSLIPAGALRSPLHPSRQDSSCRLTCTRRGLCGRPLHPFAALLHVSTRVFRLSLGRVRRREIREPQPKPQAQGWQRTRGVRGAAPHPTNSPFPRRNGERGQGG